MDQSEERQDKMSVPSLPLAHTLNINWVVPESIKTLHATNLLVQQKGTEFNLLFFEVFPPIVTGTPEEQAQAYKKIESVNAHCVARIVLSMENMQEMLQLLNQSMSNFQEQLRYLANLSKEQNDDANNR